MKKRTFIKTKNGNDEEVDGFVVQVTDETTHVVKWWPIADQDFVFDCFNDVCHNRPKDHCYHYSLCHDGTGGFDEAFEVDDDGPFANEGYRFTWRNRYHYKEALMVLCIGRFCRHQTGLNLYEMWKLVAEKVYNEGKCRLSALSPNRR